MTFNSRHNFSILKLFTKKNISIFIYVSVLMIFALPARADARSKSCQNHFVIDYLVCSINSIFSLKSREAANSNNTVQNTYSNQNTLNGVDKTVCADTLFLKSRHKRHHRTSRYSRHLLLSGDGDTLNNNYDTLICVRSGPGLEYDVISRYRTVPQVFTIYMTSDGWRLVGVPDDGTLGWVKGFFTQQKMKAFRSRKKLISRSFYNKKIGKILKFEKSRPEQMFYDRDHNVVDNDKNINYNDETSLPKSSKGYEETEPSSNQNESDIPVQSPLLNFGFSMPHDNDITYSIGDYSKTLPYFAAPIPDATFPNVNYYVFYDDVILNNENFPRINENTNSNSLNSAIMTGDAPKSLLPENRLFNLVSGVANFDKFMITDDGHIHVSAGVSDQFNLSSSGNQETQLNDLWDNNTQSWVYMPLILASRLNTENQSVSGYYRVRNIQRSGLYSKCTHTVTDGLKGNLSSNKSEFIVGNAEICFDNSGRKAMITYGYELWERLSKTNRDNCLSIDKDHSLCRVRDSRLKPLVSFWTSAN